VNMHAYLITLMFYFLALGFVGYMIAIRITIENFRRKFFPSVPAATFASDDERWRYA
jgi:tellurite resistance protein TehA-like permease